MIQDGVCDLLIELDVELSMVILIKIWIISTIVYVALDQDM